MYFIKHPDYHMGYVGISGAQSKEVFSLMDALQQLPSERKHEIVAFFNRVIGQDRATAEDLLADPFIKDAALRLQEGVHVTFEKLTR
ncbi:hypothetical protein [Xanthomonas cassavae]|uniref:hypothetical protein n=1 Tax=Xanthomonas cassavae TaxID=56450 RepID=UPI0004239FF6|nr:hypothetical protein [Xanthomonas cassavae]